MLRLLLAAGLWACAAGALAQQNAPPTPTRDIYMIYVQVMGNLDAAHPRVAARAGRNDEVISFPLAYRRTGVLLEDVRFPGAWTTFVRAGAHGYYAGEFGSNPALPRAGRGMWCFTEEPGDETPATRCVLQQNGDSWIAGSLPSNPYLPVSVGVYQGARGTTPPNVEERSVAIHPDLRAGYTFSYSRIDAFYLQLRVGGRPIAPAHYLRIARETDGSGYLETPAGVIRLTPHQGRRGVNIQLIAPSI
ncbi:MAG: hypothetical protein AB7J28_06180 [Hyphomonadaceae bacterium]